MKKINLFFAAALTFFVSCASDDTVNKDNEQEPDTKGLTGFVEEDNATRTTAEYDGSGLNFYWTHGDRLWVNTGTATSPVLTQDDHNNINSKLENNPANSSAVKRIDKAKFYFAGTFTASSYPVRYTGKNGVSNKVTIEKQQSQTIPNDASHIGEDGDCGIATATKPIGSEAYVFTLTHKAAYATFLPFNSPGEIKGAKITKINVSANEAIAGTYNFTDNGLDLTSPTSTSNSIEFTLSNNFYLPKAVTAKANAATMVITPGTYTNFTVEYTLHDPATGVGTTITKTYPSVTFTAGKNKKVHTDLQVTVYPGDKYHMWDAKQQYWYGYEWTKNLPAGIRQPTLIGPPAGNYPQNNSNPRYYNESFPGNGISNPAVNSCKDLPNANEMVWYAQKGDPRWDANKLWATMGHLYKGGMWFKKKSKINSFNANAAPDGTDWRTTDNTDNWPASQTLPSAADAGNYFYLPLMGYYVSGLLNDIGNFGYYWSSSAGPWNSDYAYYLFISSGSVYVANYYRYNGFRVGVFE
ncbi:MAG: hypothetical protein ACTTJL_08070 [Hoylesella enoeca]|uniref:hypothetical protein n=1 Tax=Hoylesella enoeca TaxID=76123 RepID=UPI003FA05CEC